ncbi:uncharacterized protein LOC132751461 [Ruditapes philippinarum]|uniref:uncharacterized protein LOC132751461 n=1 Tax=Ruditapes philippinarum TaxID=129788 RepID=UPI00295B510B|nr:uncharacterized protein LOC132751461 [Ruditapes philippinarum]
MAVTRTVIGVDVGGTNTDAVVIDRGTDKLTVLSHAKTLTTADVTTGVKAAIHLGLLNSRKKNRTLSVQQVNIGTTHFINAVVEGKHLAKVAVIRLCGTASRKLPPFCDFPEKLASKIRGSVFLLNGGYQFDGTEITEINEKELENCVDILKSNGEKNIAVSGIFSPVRDEQERRVVDFIRKRFPEASVTSSHEIGKIGMLERENATILNECIKPLCLRTIKGFRSALDDLGLKCPLYLTQNDGTILEEEKALRYPVFSFASGATNSMRGAAFLTGLKEAIVIDIGGTSTDVGVLLKGFAREASTEVKVGGIRTNFRMPDVISIGLGGGSYVTHVKVKGQDQIVVGPQSAGYCIDREAFVFAQPGEIGDRVLTATDVAVASGIANVGLISNVKHLNKEEINVAVDKIKSMITVCVDQMRFNDRNLPLILVGGGSIIVDRSWKFDGISDIFRPEYFDVANAIGAALSQISTTKDRVVDLEKYFDTDEMNHQVSCKLIECSETSEEKSAIIEKVRKTFFQSAREKAMQELLELAKQETIASGADSNSICLVEKDDISLSYIPGNATRIKLKVVGDLKIGSDSDKFVVPESFYNQRPPQTGLQTKKQTITNTGVILSEDSNKLKIETPTIDKDTGEWLLSEYDIECIHIGAGILGCGGGGSPHLGRLLALRSLRSGKKIRVLTPSRFYQNAHPENDLVCSVAFMGAPVAVYEKLVAGNETTGALACLQDLYCVGGYKDGDLTNKDGVDIVKEEHVTYIDDYKVTAGEQLSMGDKRLSALMSGEIGGMNGMEPLVVGAALDLPVLDCDGMGRAFPELQMFTPFIYGNNPYPATLADDKGRHAAILYADSPKSVENHFRKVVINMGCSGGTVLSHFNKDRVLSSTVLHSTSHAWRIGDTILRARTENTSPVDEVVKLEHGKILVYGKISDVLRETTGGFNKGKFVITGLDQYAGKTINIEFQNEFLIAREVSEGNHKLLACVPDLITLMDADTAQPIQTEELRFGIRVAVVAMRASPTISSEQALKFVGPQAFGYGADVQYTPLCDFVDAGPIGPM